MISCILTFHKKQSVVDAIESVLAQTYKDFELIVVDSGKAGSVLVSELESYRGDSRIKWVQTYEPDNARDLFCPISKCFNIAFARNLVKGDYFCTFYDDDIYYPNFFERMVGYLEKRTDRNWVRCSQRRTTHHVDGREETPMLMAEREIEQGFDCVVDGGQVVYRTAPLLKLPMPYMDEDPAWDSCSHSDGLFFEKIAPQYGTMGFVEDCLMENRKMTDSTYSPARAA